LTTKIRRFPKEFVPKNNKNNCPIVKKINETFPNNYLFPIILSETTICNNYSESFSKNVGAIENIDKNSALIEPYLRNIEKIQTKNNEQSNLLDKILFSYSKD
jgi:hypothetical protein